MGADLVVHIVKGPAKITNSVANRAARHACQVVQFAQKVNGLLGLLNTRTLTDKEGALLAGALEDPRLKDFAESEQIDRITDASSYLNDIATSDPAREVDRFVEWWNTCGVRDTSWVFDPDNMKKKIVVCGDTTWGDEPSGDGYALLSRAYWFGIPQRVGIR